MDSDNESVQSIHTDDENDLERIIEGEVNEDGTVEVQRDKSDDEKKDEEKKDVKPKRVIRNPQPKLNDQALIGPRGIASLEKYFERVQFKGKGHEEKDLDVLLKTYEYWCHRLFPKFPFETCIEKIEKLGHKKSVITHIKRIRYDLILNDAVDNDQVEDLDEDNERSQVEDTQEELFDNLVGINRQETAPQLTEEQLERIRINKERAEKLRRERLQKAKEKALNILSQEESQNSVVNEDPPQSNLQDIYNEIQKEIDINSDLFDSQEQHEESSSQKSNSTNKETENVEIIKRRKKIALIESDDSDDEITSQKSKVSEQNEEANVEIKRQKKRIGIIESDESDNEEIASEISKNIPEDKIRDENSENVDTNKNVNVEIGENNFIMNSDAENSNVI